MFINVCKPCEIPLCHSCKNMCLFKSYIEGNKKRSIAAPGCKKLDKLIASEKHKGCPNYEKGDNKEIITIPFEKLREYHLASDEEHGIILDKY